MNSSLQAEESSTSKIKIIALAIAILTLCGLAVWVGLEMLLRLTSGQS
jgi:hypothetical protein